MANTPGTSFIPKKTVQKLGTPVRRKRFYVVSFVTGVVFFSSILLSAGTFFYKDYSQSLLIEQQSALADERNKFSESDIASIRELEHRIIAAERLIDAHVSISQVLTEIENHTVSNIHFSEFTLKRGTVVEVSVEDPFSDGSEGGKDGVALQLTGISPTFNSVIVQKEALKTSDLFSDAIVKNVKYGSVEDSEDTESEDDEEFIIDEITFELNAVVDPSAVAYQGVGTTQTRSFEQVQGDVAEPASAPEESSEPVDASEQPEEDSDSETETDTDSAEEVSDADNSESN